MHPLRIEICNERLLPRFGVDRLLILLARHLADAGHEVSALCLRCDEAMLAPIMKDVTVIAPPDGLDMAATEAAVWKIVAARWKNRRPDMLIAGGWPFYETAARARVHGVKSLYIDAGAVAQNGIPRSLAPVQQELRRIRQLAMPLIDRVLPISDFIRTSQTEWDRGNDTGVRTILLGADHMAEGIFGGSHDETQGQALLAHLDAQIRADVQFILVLGRFEAQGYKNSPVAYDLLSRVREQVPMARLLLLDAGQDCGIPDALEPCVERLGAPDDRTLQEVMRRCALGVSLSLWEGFNLPVAEMQWLDRPALAFNLGAHPEIIADPWLLCGGMVEMAAKAVALLRGKAPIALAPRFAAFRERSRWESTLTAWQDEIVALAAEPPSPQQNPWETAQLRRIVLVDVSGAARNPANPGVSRVTRRLCAELQWNPAFQLVFAYWDSEQGDYRFLDDTRTAFLEGFGGPSDGLGQAAAWGNHATPERFIASIDPGHPQPPILFLPEVMFDAQAISRMDWAKRNGYRSAALLYDLIPVQHPEFCDPIVRDGFPAYLRALAQVDAVWSISDFSLKGFEQYAARHDLALPPIHQTIWLPGQFGGRPRVTIPNSAPSGAEIRILCVSTLEPRKNHLRLVEAFQALRKRRPDLPLRLILVGNRYAGALEIAAQIEAAAKRDPHIEWRGIASDAQLSAEFEKASLTIYPSLVEGFGLPILESLWMGLPCLVHDGGVMRELAIDGGCLMADMTDPAAISAALERLAADPALRARLRREAAGRAIATWGDYAAQMADRLLKL